MDDDVFASLCEINEINRQIDETLTELEAIVADCAGYYDAPQATSGEEEIQENERSQPNAITPQRIPEITDSLQAENVKDIKAEPQNNKIQPICWEPKVAVDNSTDETSHQDQRVKQRYQGKGRGRGNKR